MAKVRDGKSDWVTCPICKQRVGFNNFTYRIAPHKADGKLCPASNDAVYNAEQKAKRNKAKDAAEGVESEPYKDHAILRIGPGHYVVRQRVGSRSIPVGATRYYSDAAAKTFVDEAVAEQVKRRRARLHRALDRALDRREASDAFYRERHGGSTEECEVLIADAKLAARRYKKDDNPVFKRDVASAVAAYKKEYSKLDEIAKSTIMTPSQFEAASKRWLGE